MPQPQRDPITGRFVRATPPPVAVEPDPPSPDAWPELPQRDWLRSSIRAAVVAALLVIVLVVLVAQAHR